MKTYMRWIGMGMVVLGWVLSGCSAARAPEPAPEPVVKEAAVEVEAPAMPTPEPQPTAAPTAGLNQTSGHALPEVSQRSNRLIVKNAELKLLVGDTDLTIDGVAQIVGDVDGYIISSRVWYQEWQAENYKYATITLGVPVDQFETAMRRLRNLAMRVVDETASGQDVTDEYVDLQSRLGNLEATRDRIREFLDQAQSVDEALKVNAQLAEVEAEIEQVQGRMNYLFDRAAFSTITVQVEPELPPLPETPTPTPTPAPTPIPPWSPAPTIRSAWETLTSILQILVDMTIWLVIVVLPFLIPPLAILVGVRYWVKHKA
ncbi:MAG: DUF4349 domain-containing protein [Anaerolineae bacterium]|nr:DUF4349 domain-containing protein [Anaerolineae bacterium]